MPSPSAISPMSPMSRWLSPRIGFGLLASLYLLSFPYHPGLRSPNELCRLWQSRAIVDHGTLNLNATLMQWGMVGDLSCTAVVESEGRQRLLPCVGPDAPHAGVVGRFYYPSKAPLLSFLGAGVYWVLSQFQAPVSELSQVYFSRLFLTVLPALAMLVLLRRFLGTFVTAAVSDLLTIAYGLGTMAFSYAQSFMSHQSTACLLFAAFFVAWRVERGQWREWGYLLAGGLAGLTVMTEYTGALGVVCVALFVVASRWGQWLRLARAAGLVVAGAAPFLLALLAYHHACFGSPWASGYKFLNDAAYMGWHEGGFLGIRLPQARAFFLSLFSPLRGLFALSPFLALAPFGLAAVKRRDAPQFVMLVALLVANSYFTASFTYESWGWTVGPRHLTPLLPFLVLPVALWFEGTASSFWRSVGAGALVSSVLATGLVAFVNYVPDDVSTSLFGLAVPLLAEGVFPVSWLAGVLPNPSSGLVLMVALGAVAAWLGLRLRALGAAPTVLLATIALHFFTLRLFTRNDAADVNARTFLKQQWVAPSGRRLPF